MGSLILPDSYHAPRDELAELNRLLKHGYSAKGWLGDERLDAAPCKAVQGKHCVNHPNGEGYHIWLFSMNSLPKPIYASVAPHRIDLRVLDVLREGDSRFQDQTKRLDEFVKEAERAKDRENQANAESAVGEMAKILSEQVKKQGL